jgi:hypothetical protein
MRNYHDFHKGGGLRMTKNVNLFPEGGFICGTNPLTLLYEKLVSDITQSVLLKESIERVIIMAVNATRKTISPEM